MPLGKATLLEVSNERAVNKNVFQVVLCHFGFSGENPETVRMLRSSEQERDELKAKCLALLTALQEEKKKRPGCMR